MISHEEHLSLLLWGLKEIPGIQLADWIRSHQSLFGRYVDTDRLCSYLDPKESPLTAIAHRVLALSGAGLPSSAPGDGMYSLKSVFHRLKVAEGAADGPAYYPVAPLTLSGIFPEDDCKELPGGLPKGLESDLHLVEQNPPEQAAAFCTVLDTLFKRHLWCIPAGTGKDVDVSLYERLRTNAAAALCLKRAGEDHPAPYLLLTADFSGIQNYIFSVAHTNQPGVSKRLRARSFLVDVMIQSLAYLVCDRVDVPYENILMLTGGKFHILLPNDAEMETRLSRLRNELEEDLFRRFRGDISVNMAWVTFGDEGFLDYSSVVRRLSLALRREKFRMFHPVLTDENGWDEDRFLLEQELQGKKTCPACGRRLMDQQRTVCPECEEQEQLGGLVMSAKTLWFSREGGEFLLWDGYWLSFSRSMTRGEIIRAELLNDWSIPAVMTRFPLGVRLMVNRLPRDSSGEVMTFGNIAGCSTGSKKLAVLKADVDNLGYLFADGLRDGDRHYGTMPRVSTLSRYLELFFSGYITSLLKTRYPQVYSVFSGGDDLFLIGPWDIMPRLALELQKAFRRFSGCNPSVTLSAAVYVSHSHANIARLAQRSEELLKQVKNSAPQALYPGKTGRNGVAFLGDIFSWEDFETQLNNMDALRPAVGSINIAVLRRIQRYSGMYRRFLVDHDVMGLMFEPLMHSDQARNYPVLRKENLAFFLQYAERLSKNAANYHQVNRDLYFAETVFTCILNQEKEER